jgi:hypothetical protein
MKAFGFAEEERSEQEFVLVVVVEAIIILQVLGYNGMIKSFLGKKQFILSFLIKVIIPSDDRTLQNDDA